jgi:GNAT superfamily N-acetyltransferase
MLIEKLGRHLRDEGFATTARRALAYLFRLSANAIYRSHIELVFECDLCAPMPEAPASRLIVREFIHDDAAAVQQFIRQYNVHADYGLRRFAYNIGHGFRAVLATTLDGEIVGYGWWGNQSKSHPAQQLHGIRLGPKELYVFDLFVAPPFRKSTMALEFLIRAQQLGREHNFDRIVSTILESNRRSIRLHHLAGFHEIDYHRVHTLFNLVMVCGKKAIIRDQLWF